MNAKIAHLLAENINQVNSEVIGKESKPMIVCFLRWITGNSITRAADFNG